MAHLSLENYEGRDWPGAQHVIIDIGKRAVGRKKSTALFMSLERIDSHKRINGGGVLAQYHIFVVQYGIPQVRRTPE